MNQKQFINNNNGELMPLEHSCATKSTFSQEIQQQDYCEFPRNDPGFLNRRNSAGPIPFVAHNEVLVNDPLMVRHNTIGNYKFSPINEFSINVVNEHSQQHSEVNDQKQIHECDACNKRLCSLRSLKRHKNTCKRVRSQLDQGTGTEATMTTKEINMSNKSKSKNMNTGVITTSDNKKDFFQDSNSSFKTDQSNNTSSGSAINKTNILIPNSESINMEDDKVSDIVDSVVAKIRSQSNFNKALITNHANVQSSYQSTPSQPKQPNIEHFEITNVMNATSSMNPPFVYNNGGTSKQSQPISEERHIYVESYERNSQRIPAHKFQLPPKSAPAVAPTQQFWPVMGTRLVQHIDGKSKNTASQITAHHNPDQINNNGDYSYSLSQYPTVAFDDSLYNKQVISANIQTVQQQQFNPKQSDGERTPIVNTGTESSKQEVPPPIKNVFRFLCPECNKPYSCRKNVKRHRVSQHKVSAQEAQDGFIKRITLPENQLQQIEQKKVNNKTEPSSPIKINAKNEIQKREEIKTFTCKNEPQFHQNINQAEHQTTSHSNRPQQPNNPNAVYPMQHEARGGPPYSAPLPNQPQQTFFTYPGPYGSNHFNYPHIDQSHNQDTQAQFYSQQQYQSYYPPSQPSMNIHSYNYNQQHQSNYQQSNNQQHAYSINSGQLQPSNLLYGASHQIQQPLIRNSKIISTSTGCYANANYHQQPQSLQYRQHQPTNEPYSHGQHPMEQGNQLVGTSNSVINYTDTLEYWEQIKSMDLEPTTSDSDAIEMAKILEDLKRSDEEVAENGQPKQQAHQLNFSQQLNTTSMDTVNRGIQRKAVELAEADTTFSPPQPDDSISRQSSNPSGIQRSNQQFSQFISLGHQIPESPSYAIPSQTIFQFNHRTATNAKTEPIQQYISATNSQKADNNRKYVECSSNNIKQTNRKNNKDANGGTRKKKNIKGVQIEENIKRKKPEEFPYVDPDSTMNENPVEDADQSSISFTGIYQTNSSIEQSSTMHDIHGGSVFKNIYHR